MTEIPCTHWHAGECLAGHFERPSAGVCLQHCTHYDGPSRGRGDLLKKIIGTVTVGLLQPCVPCGQRQIDQNEKHPAGWVQDALRQM